MSSNVTTPAAKSGSMAAHHSFTVSATVATTNPTTTVDKKRAIERMALEKSNFVSQQKASAGAAACVV